MRLHLSLLLAAMLMSACGGAADVSAGASDGAAASAPAGSTVAVQSTDLGSVLVDGEGRTLYLLTDDEQGASTCYEECATNWPPMEGPAQAGDGADESLLGVTERDDGTSQATYNDWPLYYFAGDAQPGDLNGQAVGGVWFVLDAAGEPIEGGDGEQQTRDY